MTRALVTPFKSGCRRFADEIISRLRSAKIDVLAEDDNDPALARVLAVGDETGAEELPSMVSAVSASGARRTLVLTAPEACLSGQAWTLLRHGASDVMTWDGPHVASAAAARLSRWREVEELIRVPQVRQMMVGDSPVWQCALRRVVEVARWSRAAVLVTGASGTGKELVAKLIHRLQPKQDKGQLVIVDGSTVTANLSGSEFFGHEKGAFTGAAAPRDGAFALADGGTLFLDEVGELSPTMQAELLRVVQEGSYKRVGSNQWRQSSFRLICATNRDLVCAEREGLFRMDFYHRISATRVHLPALAERRADILPLFRHFLAQANPDLAGAEVAPEVAMVLMERDYPGNIRDLRALALRVAGRHVGPGPITPGDLPEEERPQRAPAVVNATVASLEEAVRLSVLAGLSLKDIRDSVADHAIHAALSQCDGRLAAAAKLLGVTDRALQLRRAGRRPRAIEAPPAPA